MSRKLSHEEFLSRLHGNALNLEILGEYQGRHGLILCRCKRCGREWYPYANSLMQGHGCYCTYKKEKINKHPNPTGRPVRDLTGMVFGLLYVTSRNDDINARHGKYWNCTCSCGKKVTYISHDLVRGSKVSCGSAECETAAGRRAKINTGRFVSKDISGMRFGRLTAIEVDTSIVGRGHTYWKCLCDCGNYHVVSSKHLVGGQTGSCGKCGYRSKGEMIISKILDQNGLDYKNNSTYMDCRSSLSGYLLRFDFIVESPDGVYCIEFDGEQHFKNAGGLWNSRYTLEKQRVLDEDKNEWCRKNSIPLIRIPFSHVNMLNMNDLTPSKTEFLI